MLPHNNTVEYLQIRQYHRIQIWVMAKLIFVILFCQLFLTSLAQADGVRTATICVDVDPPPPGAVKRDANGKKIINIEGISVDIVRAAFAHMGQKVEFSGELPWNRCLREVELGTIDFALGVYFNEERAKIYDFSTHYSTLTPQLFYLSTKPVSITQSSDFKNYRGCGIYGSSYAHYDLSPDVLDLGMDYDSLYRKLLSKRCDYFVEEWEAVFDSSTGKGFLANPLVVHTNLPWAKSPARHLVTAKNGPNSAMLVQINAALDFVIKSGAAEQAWKKSMGDIPYKP